MRAVVEKLDGLARCRAEPLGEPLRADVGRGDRRDEPLYVPLGVRPFAHRSHGLGRVPVPPVLARERPAELRLRELAGTCECRMRPGANVPDQETRAPQPAAVLAPDDGERAAAVVVP